MAFQSLAPPKGVCCAPGGPISVPHTLASGCECERIPCTHSYLVMYGWSSEVWIAANMAMEGSPSI